MSNQADVQSVDALKEFRVAMALFAEDAMQALGGVNSELRRTVQWVQHDRREYWEQQIKRRREQVAMAKAEVFRRKLAATADSTPAMSEQKELLRKAEAALQDAEARARLVKKWETGLQQAALEYHATTARMKNLASGDVPRAVALLERMIVALEAYLDVSSGSGAGPGSAAAPAGSVGAVVETVMDEDAEDDGPEPADAGAEADPEGPAA